MAYKRDWLNENGAPYLMALIFEKITNMDEPFVTYGQAAEMLETKLSTTKIFPLHIGGVAGELMTRIRAKDKGAPPINALVTNAAGIPGEGFGSFHDTMWRSRRGAKWASLSKLEKLDVVKAIRDAVLEYPNWQLVIESVLGELPAINKTKKYSEQDGKPPEMSFPIGTGESEQHRQLKEWACRNPSELGLSSGFVGRTECDLLSGDRVDVLFSNGEKYVVVEVKSILSSDDDLRRGIYQCVKYREVIKATRLPVQVSVSSILLSQRELPSDLSIRAKLLGIRCKVKYPTI